MHQFKGLNVIINIGKWSNRSDDYDIDGRCEQREREKGLGLNWVAVIVHHFYVGE